MNPFPSSRLVPRLLVIVLAATLVWSVLYGSLLWTIAVDGAQREPEQQAQHAAIVEYLAGPVGAQNPLGFLTAAEQSHMTDVKRLFDAAFLIHVLLIGASLGAVIVLAYQRLWRSIDDLLARGMWWGGWSLIGVMGLSAIAAVMSFDRFWALFHVFAFPQGNWMFAPDSALITIYPSSYFASIVFGISLRAGITAAVLILLGTFLSKARAAQEAFTARAVPGASGTSQSSGAVHPRGSVAATSRARGGSSTSQRRSAGRGRAGRRRA